MCFKSFLLFVLDNDRRLGSQRAYMTSRERYRGYPDCVAFVERNFEAIDSRSADREQRSASGAWVTDPGYSFDAVCAASALPLAFRK